MSFTETAASPDLERKERKGREKEIKQEVEITRPQLPVLH